MILGRWFRRIAAATVLTLGLGLIAGGGTAFGLALPAVDPALASDTTLPGTSSLPSTSTLPIDPQQAIGATIPATPISPTQPSPTGPSGPSGAVASPTPSSGAQATVSGAHKGSLQSIGRGVRSFGTGNPASRASGSAPAAHGSRRAASLRRKRPRRSGHTPSGAGFQLFHPSQLDHLGRILPRPTSPTSFLGGFSTSATGRADWAPPLLTIMLLIGLGGFLRVAMSAQRHPR
jgi:hypothetical protein